MEFKPLFLLIEDNLIDQIVTQQLLKKVFHVEEIIIANNGKEGIEWLQDNKTNRPFIILLDIQMPGMLGTQFLESLRTKPMVIFVTAYDQYAIKAFEVNLRLVPGNVKAHKWLHKLYSEENRNLEKANIHLDFLRESLKGERIILTEAIEQNQGKVLDFIQRLGIPTYDAEKYGERAKNLHLNAQWLDELSNEVIFIPNHSLSFLPDHFHYKLIYLQTDVDLSARLLDQRLNAVLSTKKMETMELEQRKIEAWIDSQAKLPVLYLSHE